MFLATSTKRYLEKITPSVYVFFDNSRFYVAQKKGQTFHFGI